MLLNMVELLLGDCAADDGLFTHSVAAGRKAQRDGAGQDVGFDVHDPRPFLLTQDLTCSDV